MRTTRRLREHLTVTTPRIFVVAGLSYGTPWPLRLEPSDRESAERAIRWQVEGGMDRADFALATYDADRREFCRIDDGSPVRFVDRAPYTAEAWERFQAAFPSAGVEG